MPFCDILNAFADFMQQFYNVFFAILGQPVPNLADSFGSILGCNIV
ncbi:MAG: hypothetical protein AABZ08_11005 [Planctomycetota bacterium]|jgi:hypothetical protein